MFFFFNPLDEISITTDLGNDSQSTKICFALVVAVEEFSEIMFKNDNARVLESSIEKTNGK